MCPQTKYVRTKMFKRNEEVEKTKRCSNHIVFLFVVGIIAVVVVVVVVHVAVAVELKKGKQRKMIHY